TANCPVREARFPFIVTSGGSVTGTADGGVHALFTITGRSDAGSCTLAQPNCEQMADLHNLIFRIPTPVFGAGLIENIADATILANMKANSSLKQRLGISGHPNFSGNDGTVTRFGWKAQNKSLEIFAGEAYNVEMGVSNELFPNERPSPGGSLPASCIFNGTRKTPPTSDRHRSGRPATSWPLPPSCVSWTSPRPPRPLPAGPPLSPTAATCS